MRNFRRTINPQIRQKIYSFIIAYMVSFLGLLNCVNAITNEFGFTTSIDTILCYGILLLTIVLGVVVIVIEGQIKKDLLLLIALLFVAYIATYIFFPTNRACMFTEITDLTENPLYILVLYSVTGFVFARYLNTYVYLKKYLFVLSYVVVGISIIVYFFIPESDANQYMTLSYNMLLQLSFLIMNIPLRGKILHYIFILIGSFVIVVGGARGAALALLVELILILLLKRNSHLKKILGISILSICILVIVVFYNNILDLVGNWLNISELDSRTLELLLKPMDDISSGRFDIQIYLLKDWTILGKGLYGDRVLLKSSLLFGKDAAYAHNLFVEWIVDFGVVAGGMLSCTFIILLINAMKNKKNDVWPYIIVFVPTGFIHLMFSGSYLNQSPSFYILLGLCVNSLIEERKRKRYEGITN